MSIRHCLRISIDHLYFIDTRNIYVKVISPVRLSSSPTDLNQGSFKEPSLLDKTSILVQSLAKIKLIIVSPNFILHEQSTC